MSNFKFKDLYSLFPYIVEVLPVLVFLVEDNKIVYVNKTCEELLGYKRSELIGKTIVQDLVPEDDRPKAFQHCQRVISGIREEGVYFGLVGKNGSIRKFLWKCLRIKEDTENQHKIVAIAIDATEFLTLAERVESLHKTTTFSEFLRGLVHDFNNILNNVTLTLKKLKSKIDDREEALVTIRNLEFTINSWIDLNRLLLDYSRISKEAFKSQVDLIQFLLTNLEAFLVLLGEKIRLNIDLDYLKEATVPGDTILWRYIFLNLLINAKDAIGEEGDIFIKINKEWDPEKSTVYLRIAIKDSGCGIPPEILPNIFNPFFTTKEKGSGLGLYLVHHNIKSLGGWIEVESTPGVGTTFLLYVPLLRTAKIASPKKESLSLSGVTILLLEDEEDIRENLKFLLEHKGAKVYAFSNLKDLMENLPSESPQILITDYHLPEVKGDEVYKLICRRYPEIKPLYITGDPYLLAEISEERLLLKPFRFEDLLEKLWGLL